MLATKDLPDQETINLLREKSFPKGSRTWNFLISCKNLISEQLTWDIRDGFSSLFWEDSWGGYPPIADSLNIPITEN